MNEESKQQRNQEQTQNQDHSAKEQKENTGYGDKKLEGPDHPST
jgi:hypothetical protein